MKVYISCHHPDPAQKLAGKLLHIGCDVVSDWHDSDEIPPEIDDRSTWEQKAEHNLALIEDADALVVIASPEHVSREKCVPGGKFFEAGFAYGYNMDVYTIGGCENGMMSLARNFDTMDDFVAHIEEVIDGEDEFDDEFDDEDGDFEDEEDDFDDDDDDEDEDLQAN